MNCIFCSTCYKNEGFLNKSFDNIIKLKSLFNKFKVIICYDNSGDNTLKELCDLKKKYIDDLDIEILFNKKERFNMWYGRSYNIAQARNHILNYIQNQDYDNHSEDLVNEYDYFIMADIDDVFNFDFDMNGLSKLSCYINNNEEWDSLSFWNEGFYDTWSVSIDDFQDSSWIVGEDIEKGWEKQYKIRDYLRKVVEEMSQDLRPIDSIFNGFAIHKLDKFINIRYKPATILDERILMDCEHRSFYKEANKQGLKVMFCKVPLFKEMININELNKK